MAHKKLLMHPKKKIALVAHDNRKEHLLEWAHFNKGLLSQHQLYATGTTGKLIEEELGFKVVKLQSGPLGGDQQVETKIADGEIDFLIFFWDPPGAASPRPGREGAFAHCRGLEHPGRLRPQLRRFYDFLPFDVRRIRAAPAGL